MRPGRLFLALVALLVTCANVAHAKSIRIERMDVELTIESNGAVSVRETFRVRFEGSWNGIFRVLPEAPAGGTGEIQLTDVTDGDGNPLQAKVEIADAKLRWKIRVPGAKDATRVVRLAYRMEGVVPPGSDRILYWNAVGNGWEMPIDKVRVRVRSATGFVSERVSAFTGTQGSRRLDATIEIRPDGMIFETTRVLEAGEGLTIHAALARPPRKPGARLDTVRLLRDTIRLLRNTPLLWLPLLPLLL